MSESHIQPNKNHTERMTVGENIAAYDVVYVKSDGKLWKADADAEATAPVIGMAVASALADTIGEVLLHGIIENAAWTLTVGGIIYLSETAGAIAQTAPSGTNDVIQPLGVALSATTILFNPSLMIIIHA